MSVPEVVVFTTEQRGGLRSRTGPFIEVVRVSSHDSQKQMTRA
jgi:hypothetical protein